MNFLNFFKKKENKKNFWLNLKNKNPDGIFILAPMADVTDNPFRKVITEIGKPDLFITEFVTCDGLAHEEARERLKKQILGYEENQRPIIAQIFGGKPKNYFYAAKLCAELDYDGIDINMGCPQKNILKQKSGSELIKEENRELVRKIIFQAKNGIKKSGKNIPLSIKTRIGFNKINLDWLEFILKQKIQSLSVHLRTKKEMSNVKADWNLMYKIKKIKDIISPDTILIGNGDILTKKEGREKIKKYGIDGVMIGRGIFKNPTLFCEENFLEKKIEEKIKILKKHTEYFDKEFPENKDGKRIKNFAILKKFFKIYLMGFDGAKEMRIDLMKSKDKKEVFEKCKKILRK